MRILTICAEYAPLAKVGGLGDVTAGLSAWLAARGHEVVVVMPRYGALRDSGAPLGEGVSIDVAGEGCSVHRLGSQRAGEPAVYLVESPGFLAGGVYPGGDAEALRFLLLSRAALAFAEASGFQPDIVHCHDWHTAPAAVLLEAAPRRAAVFRNAYAVLTIHNIGYQGVFAPEPLQAEGGGDLEAFLSPEPPGDVNFLRAGIVHADAITTVSPTHATEIQTPAYGKGLDGLLRQRRHRLIGILNGVDYAQWSPETDELLPATFSADDLAGKQATRVALAGGLGLEAGEETPIVGLVTRLAEQKGIDLVVDALPELLRTRSFVCAVLGSGDARYALALRSLMQRFPGRVVHVDAHDEPLAHRIYGGSDLLLVPSLYEPCGLTQMYAMRYGTVPVVRQTGGLADTVSHFDPATGEGTGSVFRDADVGGLRWGLTTALDWHEDRAAWCRLVQNCMAQDFSWSRQGPHYEALFTRLTSAG